MTGRHRVRSESFGLITECRHISVLCRQSYFCLLDDAHCNIVECGCAHSLRCVFDVWASSSPLGYLCAKFRFCYGSSCWASLCRQIAYSLTQLIWCAGTEAFASEQGYQNTLFTRGHKHTMGHILCQIPRNQTQNNEIHAITEKQIFISYKLLIPFCINWIAKS